MVDVPMSSRKPASYANMIDIVIPKGSLFTSTSRGYRVKIQTDDGRIAYLTVGRELMAGLRDIFVEMY